MAVLWFTLRESATCLISALSFLLRTLAINCKRCLVMRHVAGSHNAYIFKTLHQCQPCLMMAPNFYHAAKKLPTVRFAKIQTDQHEQAAAEHGIRSLPTLVAFKNGHELDRLSGLRTASDIIHWVQQLA
ncbi:MAG: hypothetical protein DWP95_05595 [Proteobacteria bacterium]|nr:MAG: hypothetical protein DWP95_05595 [Pseudomonadota bacterium]